MDLPWAILFLLTLIALIIFVATSAGELGELGQAPSRHLFSSSYGYGGAPMQRVDDAQAAPVGLGAPLQSVDDAQAPPVLGQSSYRQGWQGMPADEAQAAAFPSYHLSKSEAGSLLVTVCLACVAGAAGGLILATSGSCLH